MTHCRCVYGFEFRILAAQNVDGILTVSDRNLENFLAVNPLNGQGFIGGGDHAADVFKRIQDAKKSRDLFYLEIQEIDSSSRQSGYRGSTRRVIKFGAIVESHGLLDGFDNIIMEERRCIRGFDEAGRVKGPVAEAPFGVGDIFEAPVLVRAKPAIRRTRSIGADSVSQKRLDPGVKIKIAAVDIGAGVLMTAVTFARPDRCVGGPIIQEYTLAGYHIVEVRLEAYR
jgi:hypothetical protein